MDKNRKKDPYAVGINHFREQETVETEPGLYYLPELLALRNRTSEELLEIHKAKLTFPGQRVIQEGPEKLLGQAASINLMTRRNVK